MGCYGKSFVDRGGGRRLNEGMGRGTGSSRRFGISYEESVALRDGTTVRLRFVRPEDKPLFLEAWERLSLRSRYRRFLAPKNRLTAEELRYFTEVDGEHHLALVALHGPPGREWGVGVARFVRLPGRPEAAEAAVAVTDDFQNRGLGSLLADRLARAAQEREIRWVVCEVLRENEPVCRLLRKSFPHAVLRERGGSIVVEIDLGRPAGGRALGRVVSLAARRLLALRRVLKPSPPRGGGGGML